MLRLPAFSLLKTGVFLELFWLLHFQEAAGSLNYQRILVILLEVRLSSAAGPIYLSELGLYRKFWLIC